MTTAQKLREAWNRSEANEAPVASAAGSVGDINFSSIYTILIQNVGRFCEAYASDFLYDYEYIESVLRGQPIDVILLIAIREDGTDRIEQIQNRVTQAPEMDFFLSFYRKVYALRIRTDEDGWIKGELRDFRHRLTNECFIEIPEEEPILDEDDATHEMPDPIEEMDALSYLASDPGDLGIDVGEGL